MFKTQRSKACISSFIYLITAYSAFAQLSGSVSLGGEKKAAPKDATQPAAEGASNQKQITVVGIGLTPEAAEKQAITDAVRQAVGTFIDANTVVKNEEVIKDRILSVSNGFVKEYKPTAPARKRDDGLYEITILATVESSKVVSALKEQNLISGEVAGQNLWAESATKVMKAQDGVAMLEAKLPEFIKNAVTITPLGKDGKPLLVKDANGNEVPSTAPIGISEDPVTEKSQLFWMFAIGLDNKYYKEQIIPTLIKCFDAITGSHGKEERITVRTQKKEYYLSQSIERSTLKKLSDLGIKMPSATIGDFSFDRRREPLRIIKSVSRTLDNCECISYSNNPLYGIEGYEHNFHNSQPCLLRVDLYDKNGDLISSDKQGCWQPFFWERSTGINITGPMNLENNYGEGVALPQILFSHIEVPIAISKEIKRVDVSLEVREIKLRLRSSNDR